MFNYFFLPIFGDIFHFPSTVCSIKLITLKVLTDLYLVSFIRLASFCCTYKYLSAFKYLSFYLFAIIVFLQKGSGFSDIFTSQGFVRLILCFLFFLLWFLLTMPWKKENCGSRAFQVFWTMHQRKTWNLSLFLSITMHHFIAQLSCHKKPAVSVLIVVFLYKPHSTM